MGKIFKVCLSKDLPAILERDPNYIYFLYDKLTVFLGQNLYSDPYAIVETMPEEPINGMLYFVLSDGYVKAYINYSVKNIAKIENEEQLDLLKKVGTTFFVNSEKRYLDLRRRVITLPFQNGTYELTVSLAKNLMIDENTVIVFNPETNEFEIGGKLQDYNMVFTRNYRGNDSKTVNINVSEHKISGEVKISNSYGNIIKVLSDGLYAGLPNMLTLDEFNAWVSSFRNYKEEMEQLLHDLDEQLESGQEIVSEENIANKIQQALEAEYPNIDSALAEFNKLAAEFEGIEERSKQYTDKKFSEAVDDIKSSITEAFDDPWEEFSGASEEKSTT